MSCGSPTQTSKALVLLSEQKHLEENLGDPQRYFVTLKRQSILTKKDCDEIREQGTVELQLQKCLELVTLKERGFDVLVQAMRRQPKHSSVAIYLLKKAKALEAKLSEQEPLPSEHQQVLMLLEFAHTAGVSLELGRNILASLEWNMAKALDSAREMGYRVNDQSNPGTPAGQTGERTLEHDIVDDDLRMHPIHGALPPPPVPPDSLPLVLEPSEIEIANVDPMNVMDENSPDVHPEFGIRPHPPFNSSSSSASSSSFRSSSSPSPLRCSSPSWPKPCQGPLEQGGLSETTFPLQPKAYKPELGGRQLETSGATPCTSQKTPTTACPGAAQLPTRLSDSVLPSAKHDSPKHSSSQPTLSATASKHHAPLFHLGLGSKTPPTLPVKATASSPKEPITPSKVHVKQIGHSNSQTLTLSSKSSPNMKQKVREEEEALASGTSVDIKQGVNFRPELSRPSVLASATPQRSSDHSQDHAHSPQGHAHNPQDHSPQDHAHNPQRSSNHHANSSPASGKKQPLSSKASPIKEGKSSHVTPSHMSRQEALRLRSKPSEPKQARPRLHGFENETQGASSKPSCADSEEEQEALSSRHAKGLLPPDGEEDVACINLKLKYAQGIYYFHASELLEHRNNEIGSPIKGPDLQNLLNRGQQNGAIFSQQRERTWDILSLDGKPTSLKMLSLLHANGSEVRIIDNIAHEWQDVAIALDIKRSTINIISKDCQGSCKHGCETMISTWIDSEGDVTWGHLIDALERANFKVLANDVKSFIVL